MHNLEQYKRILKFFFCSILLAIQLLLFWYIWKNYYSMKMEEPFFKRGHWMLVAIYGLLMLLFARPYGSWKIGYLKTFKIIYAQSITTILTDSMMYLVITLLTKHFEPLAPLIILFILQLAVIVCWGISCTRLYRVAYPPRKVLLIYGERPIQNLVGKLNTRTDRFIISETIPIAEDIEIIKERIDQQEGVVICDLPSQHRNRILKYCYGKSMRTYTVPKISDILIRSAEDQLMFDTPLLLSRNYGLTLEQCIIKRCLDIFLSASALLFLSPVLIITALAIRLEDGGPVLYSQERCTKNGKPFSIYKFRSMVVDAEKDGTPLLAANNDPRITRIGKIIRSTRIDELPQIFNILKGDMSIVGPRPERQALIEKYITEIPEFQYRTKVKGGLTGYAQVYGKYNTSAYDKLKLDLMYIQNYNIWLDIEIIFRTIQVLFDKSSTEGVD